MMTYTFDKKQIDELKRKLSSSQFKEAAGIALKRIGGEMEKAAREKAPYRKGHLKGSLTTKPEYPSVTVGTNVDYAAIHEFGGRAGRNHSVTIVSRPYMRPALEVQRRGRAMDILKEEISLITK